MIGKDFVLAGAIFSAGIGVGVMAARRHYMELADRIVEEEVASVRESFESLKETTEKAVVNYAEQAKEMYEDSLMALGYTYEDSKETIATVEQENASIITEEQYLEENGYAKVTMTYWRDDGVFEDENGEPSGGWLMENFELGLFEQEGTIHIRDYIRAVDYAVECTTEYPGTEDE